MSLRLSNDLFGTLSLQLRPALENMARRTVGNESEDVVSEVILHALKNLHAFDYNTGVEGLAKWLHMILKQRVSFFTRSMHHMDLCTLDRNAEARWSQLNGEKERAKLNDIELLNEVKQRLRYVSLTRREFTCITYRLQGRTQTETAQVLGTSRSCVSTHISNALRKLRRVPLDAFVSPDLDHWLFRMGSQVTIYHPPQKTGAGLSRDRLNALK